jgi:hypothetical protein
MFGGAGPELDKRVIICLAVLAAFLLLAGFVAAMGALPARAQSSPRAELAPDGALFVARSGGAGRDHVVPDPHGVQSALCPLCMPPAVNARSSALPRWTPTQR